MLASHLPQLLKIHTRRGISQFTRKISQFTFEQADFGFDFFLGSAFCPCLFGSCWLLLAFGRGSGSGSLRVLLGLKRLAVGFVEFPVAPICVLPDSTVEHQNLRGK